jgi:hypothetical protein
MLKKIIEATLVSALWCLSFIYVFYADILLLFLRVIAVLLFFLNFHATYVVEDSYDISINTFISCFVVADRA